MNINLTDDQIAILDKIVLDGKAFDRENALSFLIYYYSIKQDEIHKSNEVA